MTAVRDLALLLRPRIGLMAAAGAAVGAALSAGARPALLALAAMSALLLSAGCSALNQAQERDVDARMKRTRNRPLPAGRMAVKTAVSLGLGLSTLAGLLLLASPGGWPAALLAPLALLAYNGAYTPLKRRTSLAMLAGGLAGALPPVVGFAAAGGSPADPRALLLAAVFYAWQVPHFWLFARINQADYEAAGLRVPQHGVDRSPAGGALALWILCYGALMLLLPAFGLVAQPVPRALVAGLAVSLWLGSWAMMTRERLGFALVNGSLVLLLCFLAADALRLAA